MVNVFGTGKQKKTKFQTFFIFFYAFLKSFATDRFLPLFLPCLLYKRPQKKYLCSSSPLLLLILPALGINKL